MCLNFLFRGVKAQVVEKYQNRLHSIGHGLWSIEMVGPDYSQTIKCTTHCTAEVQNHVFFHLNGLIKMKNARKAFQPHNLIVIVLYCI